MFRNSRTRRPDRAFYIPKAKRSQTTPPSSSSSAVTECTNSSNTKSHRSKTNQKSKSIDSPSSSNSEEANEEEGFINSQIKTTKNCCDLSLNEKESPDDTKSQKNIQNLFAMSQQQANELIIDSGSIAVAGGVVDKDDKDEKELIKATQEINRSNRKLIKQSFNSNVLEIETGSGSEGKKDETVNNGDDDDWDTL